MRTLPMFLAALLAGAATAQEAPPPPAQNPFKEFDRAKFIEHVRALGADDEAVQAYEKQCEEESVAHATDAMLRSLSKAYDAAAALAEDGEPRAALELAALIQKGDDAYVRGHARYHLGRHFLDNDEPDKAAEVLKNYLRQDRNRTALDAEVAFFYGTALADVPMPAEAAVTFADFLELFPNAPERYRAVAAQRKAELEAQFESPLHGIADKMKSVSRDLRHRDPFEEVEPEQLDIVQQLQKIIEEIEEREKQSAGAAGGQRSNSPAASSALPGGESKVGALHDAPKAAERWGNYNDRERKAIEAEVNVRLTGPWKKMVEEYYKKLNEGGKQ